MHPSGHVIQSASRSPPGQMSKSLVQFKSPPVNSLSGPLLGSSFALFASCLEYFSVLGALWGCCGLTFSAKNQRRVAKVLQAPPKRRHPRNPLTYLETLWSSFLIYVRILLQKKTLLKYVFLLDLWVALSSPGVGRICNPY